MSKSTGTVNPLIAAVEHEADNLTRFDRVEPEAHFSLPARPTVRQQLEYYSRYADTRDAPLYLRLWHSAKILITDWECRTLPNKETDLNSLTDPQTATVVMWAGNVVMQYMNDLEALPKV
jgi:hypothetical protein